MTKVRFTLKALTLAIFMLAFSALANAQATRTWVSGVGDDANPCSRTAPCKTFAGAISKTFINGEIDALDPGGYGTITITKSITLDGGTGEGWASILASGSPQGVLVSLTDTSGNDPQHTVRLRHLSINGTGSSGTVGTRTGTNGVNVSSLSQAGSTVIVDSCLIDGFVSNGINATFPNGGNLVVSNSVIQESATGIRIASTAGFAVGTFNNVQIERNTTGVLNGTNAFSSMKDCNVSLNTGDGVQATGGAINVSTCLISHNTSNGVNAAGGTIRSLSNHILANGLAAYGGTLTSIKSDGQNRVDANGTNNAPTGGLVTIN
jgi:hypothetical protein